MLVRVLAGAVCGVLAVACSNASDEIAVAEQESRVGGSTLAGARHADPSATYLAARRLDSLTRLKALSERHHEILTRADGILTGTPNGVLELVELVELDKPAYLALTSAADAQITELWDLMKAAAPTSAPLTPWPAVTEEAFADPREVSVEPGAMAKPEKILVSSLSAAGQVAAKSLELVHDDDGDPNTVTEADLADALAPPTPFTLDERKELEIVKDLFVLRASTALRARVEVAAPFEKRSPLGTLGTASVAFVEKLEYVEHRKHIHRDRISGQQALLTRDYRRGVVLEGSTRLNARDRVLVIGPNGSEEIYAPPGTDIFEPKPASTFPLITTSTPSTDDIATPDAGEYTAELWQNGKRLATTTFVIAAPFERAAYSEGYNRFLDYELLVDGRPLARNVAATTIANGTFGHRINFATWRFERAPSTAIAAPADLLADLATPLATPPGRYRVPVDGAAQSVTFDVYPGGAIVITACGDQPADVRLPLGENPNSYWRAPDNTCGIRSIWIAGPESHEGHRLGVSGTRATQLTGAMREG